MQTAAYQNDYNVDNEKDIVTHKEDINSSTHDDYECEFTPAEQKKIIHRVDRRLVVTVGVLYCISLMDRTNLSSIAGCVRIPSIFRGNSTNYCVV